MFFDENIQTPLELTNKNKKTILDSQKHLENTIGAVDQLKPGGAMFEDKCVQVARILPNVLIVAVCNGHYLHGLGIGQKLWRGACFGPSLAKQARARPIRLHDCYPRHSVIEQLQRRRDEVRPGSRASLGTFNT